MKKVLLIVTTVFVFGFVNAQKMKFGVKAGLNIASQNITVPTYPGVTYSLENVIGVNLGVYGDFKISNKFSVQPELLFSMQGAKLTTAYGNQSADETHSLNYLNIPVMAKYFATEKLSIQVGPQIGFLVSATDKINSNITGLASSSTDSKADYNSVDFGLNFGLGYDFTENISLTTRYNLGLSEVEKNVPSGMTGSKNRVISLSLGYSF